LPDGVLLSIQVGKPKRRGVRGSQDPEQKVWVSGIFKEPVTGPVWLGLTNLDGDGQADRRFHGGPTRAVLAYGGDHYPLWIEELGLPELGYGAFGENFTLGGLSEANVRMGDIYTVGEARVQVSQLRAPCWKLARRLNRPDIVERVIENGRSGWYLRVLQEGFVEAGQAVRLEERDDNAPTLLDLHAKKYWR
jgi:MOSC domain-containing protein YiiM